eukprot:PhM_4_TR7932/c0_g1_i1/m.97634
MDAAVNSLATTSRHREVTFLEGESGVHVVAAILETMKGSSGNALMHIRRVIDIGNTIDKTLKSSECELLYGRAGYVYSLLQCYRLLRGDGGDEVHSHLRGEVEHLVRGTVLTL